MSEPRAGHALVIVFGLSYAILGVSGALWMSWGDYAPWPDDGLQPGPLLSAIGIGAATGIGCYAACWPFRRLKAFRAFDAVVRVSLPAMGMSAKRLPMPMAGNLFALMPGAVLAEEVFFRGAMQPALGIVIASVGFGLAHFVIPRREFWPVPVAITAIGFVLGGIHQWTGHLIAPFVAHLVFNYISLSVILFTKPEMPEGFEIEDPEDEDQTTR